MAITNSKESKEVKKIPLQKRSFFQAKLTVNSPGDQYEKEADAVAEKIVSLEGNDSAAHASGVGGLGVRPISPIEIQKKCAECEEEENIQMKGYYNGGTVDSETENGIHAAKTGGQPLPSETQSSMESGFGTGFQDVKIHHDAKSNLWRLHDSPPGRFHGSRPGYVGSLAQGWGDFCHCHESCAQQRRHSGR